MMTLKEMVRNSKAAAPAAVASSEAAETPVRGLQIVTWNAEKWVLPWGYFYSAHLHGGAGREQLVLRFAQHEVILEGLRLDMLLPEIADYQLTCLRELPAKFQVDADKSAPFINRVSVRPLAEQDQGRSGV